MTALMTWWRRLTDKLNPGRSTRPTSGHRTRTSALSVEALESRDLLTTLVLLDFDGATTGEHRTALRRLHNPSGWRANPVTSFVSGIIALNTPHGWMHQHSETVTHQHFSSGFQDFAFLDFDQNGRLDRADADEAIRRITSRVREDFAPYDVLVLRSDRNASSLDMMRRNRAHDTLIFLDDNPAAAGGQAALDAGNRFDDLARVGGSLGIAHLVFDVGLRGTEAADAFVHFTAQAISHEAGHTFGLEHPATSDPTRNIMGGLLFEETDFLDLTHWTEGDRFQNAHRELLRVLGPSGSDAEPGGEFAGHGWASLGDHRGTEFVVGRNADGRLEIFSLDLLSATAQHRWQIAPNSSWTADWSSLGGRAFRQLEVASNQDGRLELFALDANGVVWHKWQHVPNGDWTADWSSLGEVRFADGSRISDLSVGRNADGRLELFVVSGGNVRHKWQVAPNSDWTADWSSLGFVGGRTRIANLEVGANADGRLEVFARDSAGVVWHKWQRRPNGTWTGRWSNLGGRHFAQIQVAANADGRLEIFGVSEGGGVSHRWQTRPNGGWSRSWSSFGNARMSHVRVGRNLDGRLEIFGVGQDDGVLYHRWQTRANNGWTGSWVYMRGPGLRTIQVASNQDGRLELFATATDDQLYHRWQTIPNNGWVL